MFGGVVTFDSQQKTKKQFYLKYGTPIILHQARARSTTLPSDAVAWSTSKFPEIKYILLKDNEDI